MTQQLPEGTPPEEHRLDEAAPAQPKATLPMPGRTRIGRFARRWTGGPGSPTFEAAVAVRRVGWRSAERAVMVAGHAKPLPTSDDPERVGVRLKGFPTLARVDDQATIVSAHQRLLAMLDEALRAEDVPYFAIPRNQLFRELGIPASYREAAWRALARVAEREPILVGRAEPGRRTVYRDVETATARIRSANVVRAVPVVARSDGAAVLPDSTRVDLQFWKQLPEGVLGAPARNRYAPYLLRSSQERVVTIDEDTVPLRTYADLAEPHIHDLPFPVDIVYTWVDDADPAWRGRMTRAKRSLGREVTENAVADERFRNFDELRYSLRSLAQFAPWVRHVWLVTDDQTPAWLDTTHPGSTVGPHREIWSDTSVLPVFNSHAIESRLHHIPGLAEQYIYLNDDMFVGQMVAASTFFSPGGIARIFTSPEQIGLGPRTLKEGAAQTAAKNDRRIIREATGAIQTQRLKHAGYPQLRSVAMELEERFPDYYRATAASRFRSPDDISAISLQSWYAYRTGRAVPGVVFYAYADLRSGSDLTRLTRLMSDNELEMYCLNQSEQSVADPEWLRTAMHGFLEATYPFRSPYELDLSKDAGVGK